MLNPNITLARFRERLDKRYVRLVEYKGEEHILIGPIDLDSLLCASGTIVRGLTVIAPDKRSFTLARDIAKILQNKHDAVMRALSWIALWILPEKNTKLK